MSGSPLGVQPSFLAFVEPDLILKCGEVHPPGRKEKKRKQQSNKQKTKFRP